MSDNSEPVAGPVERPVRPLAECAIELERIADQGCKCDDNTSWKDDCVNPCAARIAGETLSEVTPIIRDALQRALMRSVRIVA